MSNPMDINLLLTERELRAYEAQAEAGYKPVATSLAANLYQLFLEGYTCQQIAAQGKGLSEADIIHVRLKNKWDESKSEYAEHLRNQIHSKLAKTKLEAIEYITNQMSAMHKSMRDQVLKYLMSGNPDDMPADLGKVRDYKQLIEVLQKLTGEDKVSKVNVDQQSTVTHNITGDKEILAKILDPDNAAKLLAHFAKEKQE